MLSQVKKNSKVLVICAIGGTLDTLVSYRREKRLFNDPERAFGREPPRRGAPRRRPAAPTSLPRPPAGCLVARTRDPARPRPPLVSTPATSPPPAPVPGTAKPPGESRSLKAIYELLEAGWSSGNIRHVDGGFQQWRYQGLPVESE
jgi:hypothetical protein